MLDFGHFVVHHYAQAANQSRNRECRGFATTYAYFLH
jgi:hypothetical protein